MLENVLHCRPDFGYSGDHHPFGVAQTAALPIRVMAPMALDLSAWRTQLVDLSNHVVCLGLFLLAWTLMLIPWRNL